MNVDLDKTLGHEAGKRIGAAALLKTAERTPAAGLAEQIGDDLTFMLSAAVNTLLTKPGNPAATMPMSQLVGYLVELARLTGRLAQGGPVVAPVTGISGAEAARQAVRQ